jgi:hypothetical protein
LPPTSYLEHEAEGEKAKAAISSVESEIETKKQEIAYLKELRRVNPANSSAMQNVWGKSEGRIGKLAINLHRIEAVFTGQLPSQLIGRHTMSAAISLTYFYAEQVQALYALLGGDDSLPPMLAKVLDIAERKGNWIIAKDVQLSLNRRNLYTARVLAESRPSRPPRGFFKKTQTGKKKISKQVYFVYFAVKGKYSKDFSGRLFVYFGSTWLYPNSPKLKSHC